MLEKIKSFFINSLLWCVANLLLLGVLWSKDIDHLDMNAGVVLLGIVLITYLCIKGRGVIACIAGAGISFLWMKVFGNGVTTKVFGEVAAFIIVGGVLYLFAKGLLSGSSRSNNSRREETVRTGNRRSIRDDEYDYDDSYTRETKNKGPELRSGSDEYWEIKDYAESLYRAFCSANDYETKKYYKELGEALKGRLYIDYGRSDESVKLICKNYLDMRM